MANSPVSAEGRTIDLLRSQLAEAHAERDEEHQRQGALAEVL